MFGINEKAAQSFERLLTRRSIRIIVLTILILSLYGRVLHFDLVGFDDTFFIVDQQAFFQDPSNLPETFRQDVFHGAGERSSRSYYRPMLLLSFFADAQIGQSNPTVYHGTNILLHLLASLLVLAFLKGVGVEKVSAFLLSLLFAVHPMLSQAVGWIPGRNDSLLAFFVLASMIALFRSLRKESISFLTVHYFFFLLALLTKESAVVLPLFAFYVLNFLIEERPAFRKQISLAIPYIIIVLFWLLLRKSALAGQRSDLSWGTLAGNFLGNLPLLLQYLSKIILPWRLSTYSSPEDTNLILCLFSVLLLIAGLLLNWKRKRRIIFFGLLWFLLYLAPSLVVPKITGLEHRVYLPLVGILLLLSETRLFKGAKNQGPAVVPVLACIALFIAINWNHTISFSSPIRFWQKAVEASPKAALAYMNLGAELEKAGDTQRAVEVLKTGIEVNPSEPMIHYNLAVIYFRLKIYREAEREVLAEIRVNPRYGDAYYLAGAIYKRQGNLPEARKMWQEALTVNPHHQAAREALLRYGQ